MELQFLIPNNRLVFKYDLASAAVPVLLSAYKHGIFEIGLQSEPKFVKKLAERGLFTTYHDNSTFVVMLTEKGATFVRENFLRMLEELSPIYTYPIILHSDEIEVIEDLKNDNDKKTGLMVKIFNSPSCSSVMYKGIYFVQSSDSTTLCVTDDTNIFYRVHLSNVKSKIIFRADQLEDQETELKKRFGMIRISALVKRLKDQINPLVFSEMLENLYDMSYTKNRIVS